VESGSKTKLRLSNADQLEHVVQRTLGKSRETRIITKQLLDKTSFRKWGVSKVLPSGFPALAREDLHDEGFVKKAAEHTLRILVPNVVLPNVWTFELIFSDDGSFIVGTTLDFVSPTNSITKMSSRT
jgi:hypothetical protein